MYRRSFTFIADIGEAIKIRVKLYFLNVYKKKSLGNLLVVFQYACVGVCVVVVVEEEKEKKVRDSAQRQISGSSGRNFSWSAQGVC